MTNKFYIFILALSIFILFTFTISAELKSTTPPLSDGDTVQDDGSLIDNDGFDGYGFTNLNVNIDDGVTVKNYSGTAINTGSSSTINNSGTIYADNNGIYAEGNDNIIVNIGSIGHYYGYYNSEVVGNNGIEISGASNVIMNSGKVVANNNAIKVGDIDNQVTNTGMLLTSQGAGISAGNDNDAGNGIMNDGIIFPVFKYGPGFDGIIVGNNNIVSNENDAVIFTFGNGIVMGNNNTLTQAGDIIAYGNGIVIGDNNTITQAGDINVGYNGIEITGNGNTIDMEYASTTYGGFGVNFNNVNGSNTLNVNGGTIQGGMNAIQGNSGDEIIYLNDGSTIIGNVDLGDGNDSVIFTGNVNVSNVYYSEGSFLNCDILKLNGANVSFDELKMNDDLKLIGNGTLTGEIINFNGMILPEVSTEDPIGLMEIVGTFYNVGGLLEIDIEGTDLSEYDRLMISGNASIGGLLKFNVLDDAYFNAGDTFDFLWADDIFYYEDYTNLLFPVDSENNPYFQLNIYDDHLSLQALNSYGTDPISGTNDVPEPSTIIMFGLAILGFAGIRKKRLI